jgi:putative PIN family toxin of toxin-antitoxin system
LRAVLDPNVIISAALSPGGSPGRLFRYWLEGAYELVVSPLPLDELERALGYSKLRDRVTTDETQELLEVLARAGVTVEDPDAPPEVRSPDPDDDYLTALASVSRSVLVSGDTDLLGLADQIPVYSPAEFLAMIENRNSNPT